MQWHTKHNKKHGTIRPVNNHAKNTDIHVDGVHTKNNQKLFS